MCSAHKTASFSVRSFNSLSNLTNSQWSAVHIRRCLSSLAHLIHWPYQQSVMCSTRKTVSFFARLFNSLFNLTQSRRDDHNLTPWRGNVHTNRFQGTYHNYNVLMANWQAAAYQRPCSCWPTMTSNWCIHYHTQRALKLFRTSKQKKKILIFARKQLTWIAKQ